MKTNAESSRKTQESKLFRRSIKLLPALAKRGVTPMDALAIAYNSVFLFDHLKSLSRYPFLLRPRQVLRRFSYLDIARLCESILDDSEFGFNTSFKEVFD